MALTAENSLGSASRAVHNGARGRLHPPGAKSSLSPTWQRLADRGAHRCARGSAVPAPQMLSAVQPHGSAPLGMQSPLFSVGLEEYLFLGLISDQLAEFNKK